MKIAILSDFHLGYERFREDAFNQAKEALEKASSIADALLIPGDIFDSRNPKPDVIAEGLRLFRDIANKDFGARAIEIEGRGTKFTDKPIIAIPGTHERRSEGVEDPVDLLALAGLLINAREARVIIEKGNEKVAIFGIGGISDERFRDVVKKIDPKPKEGLFNIFFFHQSVYELLPFNENFIKMDELPKGFDLYIDGHIHNRLEYDLNGKKLLIPGSTVLTQLKEKEQEQKGFYVFDTETKTYSYIYINSRKFYFIELNVENKDIEEIYKKINEKDDKSKPIFKFILKGKSKTNLSLSELEKRYSNLENAIIEIDKEGEEVNNALSGIREGNIEGITIRDLQQSIFLEYVSKMEEFKDFNISPIELLDILENDKKEEAIEELFEKLRLN